jgi:hypothetical protein
MKHERIYIAMTSQSELVKDTDFQVKIHELYMNEHR